MFAEEVSQSFASKELQNHVSKKLHNRLVEEGYTLQDLTSKVLQQLFRETSLEMRAKLRNILCVDWNNPMRQAPGVHAPMTSLLVWMQDTLLGTIWSLTREFFMDDALKRAEIADYRKLCGNIRDRLQSWCKKLEEAHNNMVADKCLIKIGKVSADEWWIQRMMEYLEGEIRARNGGKPLTPIASAERLAVDARKG